MEIITGVERRRRWRDEEKLRIVAEADAPGAVIADVARRHGVARSQIFDWRRKARSGELGVISVLPEFLPLRMSEVAEPAAASSLNAEVAPVPARSATGQLELSFPGGVVLRIEGKVDAATLRAVIAAAKG
jgi:transposase